MVTYKAKYYKKSSKSKKTSKNPGSEALRIVKRFVRKNKPEIKVSHFDALVNTNATSVGDVELLTFIDEGTGYEERVGNIANLHSLDVKGYDQWNSAGTNGQIIKVWLVHDKQQQDATNPLFTDILNNQNIVSMSNTLTTGRFSILGEYTFIQDTTKQILPFEIKKSFKKHELRFNGVSGADVQKGHMYIVFCSNRTAVQNPPVIYVNRRIKYSDP